MPVDNDPKHTTSESDPHEDAAPEPCPDCGGCDGHDGGCPQRDGSPLLGLW